MNAAMNADQAERRLRELQEQRRTGTLDEKRYRLEVAKLLWRDTHGVFWMPDTDTGTWFCNMGDGWVPGDPHAEPHLEAVQPKLAKLGVAKPRRFRWLMPAGFLLLTLVAAALVVIWLQYPQIVGTLFPPTPTEPSSVRVTVASPADGSQAALGQVVAIEVTISGSPDLGGVSRVDFRANGELVATQPVQAKIQPGQASLPLSQAWRPTSLGEYEVSVIAYSAQDSPLGTGGLSLSVVETPDVLVPEAACSPGAAFVADVTIPPGTAFPPGARMDKVWQVRNDGSCAWGVGYELVLVQGEDLGAPGAVPVPSTASDQMADLAVTFWAPAEAGSFVSVWQLQGPDGQFFGPTLPLSIEVQIQAVEALPPDAPTGLQATVVDEGEAVRLSWDDRSDNEDAFRIYREDVEASIGLAPADAQQFVDVDVACGHTYQYSVLAFNAAGVSPTSEIAEASLPPCALPADEPPSLILTVVPTQVVPAETFNVIFQANDDVGVASIQVQGQDTGDPAIDAGRSFTCTVRTCTGVWPLVWSDEVSTTQTLTLTAIALDSSGHESDPMWTTVSILPPE
jgi:hypothetical protein